MPVVHPSLQMPVVCSTVLIVTIEEESVAHLRNNSDDCHDHGKKLIKTQQ